MNENNRFIIKRADSGSKNGSSNTNGEKDRVLLYLCYCCCCCCKITDKNAQVIINNIVKEEKESKKNKQTNKRKQTNKQEQNGGRMK